MHACMHLSFPFVGLFVGLLACLLAYSFVSYLRHKSYTRLIHIAHMQPHVPHTHTTHTHTHTHTHTKPTSLQHLPWYTSCVWLHECRAQNQDPYITYHATLHLFGIGLSNIGTRKRYSSRVRKTRKTKTHRVARLRDRQSPHLRRPTE
jgi:hypothetical protein